MSKFIMIFTILLLCGCEYVAPSTNKAMSETKQVEEMKKQTDSMEKIAKSMESIANSLGNRLADDLEEIARVLEKQGD